LCGTKVAKLDPVSATVLLSTVTTAALHDYTLLCSCHAAHWKQHQPVCKMLAARSS
jgi:hypothetical protein